MPTSRLAVRRLPARSGFRARRAVVAVTGSTSAAPVARNHKAKSCMWDLLEVAVTP